jgi:hypothetical protein
VKLNRVRWNKIWSLGWSCRNQRAVTEAGVGGRGEDVDCDSTSAEAHSPVIAAVRGEAEARGAVEADVRMVVAVGEPLVAELTGPAGLAAALPGLPAGAVDAARVRHALGAVLAGVTDAAPAGVGPATTPVLAAAARRANRCAPENR